VLGAQPHTEISSASSVERRRGRRFALRLSCRLSPVSMKKADFAGTVINISRSGILMALDSAEIPTVVRPDDVVRVVIDLPRHPSFSPRCLECIATVVRLVVVQTQTQVAVQIGRTRVTDRDPTSEPGRDWLRAPVEGVIQ